MEDSSAMERIYVLLKPKPKEILKSKCCVREGQLIVSREDVGATDSRYVFLLNNFLLITTLRNKKEKPGKMGRKYKTLTLIEMEPDRVSLEKEGTDSFRIVTKKTPFTFKCETVSDRDGWYKDINDAVQGVYEDGKAVGSDCDRVMVRTLDGRTITKEEYETQKSQNAEVAVSDAVVDSMKDEDKGTGISSNEVATGAAKASSEKHDSVPEEIDTMTRVEEGGVVDITNELD